MKVTVIPAVIGMLYTDSKTRDPNTPQYNIIISKLFPPIRLKLRRSNTR